MTAAYYDFFRQIRLFSQDGTLLHTMEADSTTDYVDILPGEGVRWNNVNDSTVDGFVLDVQYNFEVPLASTTLRLSDVNANAKDIELVAGTNISIVRNNSGRLTFSALVGGVSKSIQTITTTNPVRITTVNQHDFAEGTPVTIVDVVGTTELNGNEYFMDIIDSTTFDLYTDEDRTVPLDGTAFTAYVSGGVATADYGGAKQAFKTIAVTGQSPIVADNVQDTLTITGGGGIDITTFPGSDAMTIEIDTNVITSTGSQTLVNKTLAFQNNTITMLLSELNTAVTDTDVVGIDETQTLTNKTLTAPVISSISNTGTLTLPTDTDTLVGRATTDTLTNKSIDFNDNTVTMTFAQLNTAISDATVVDLDDSQTLTNKSIDASNNTLSNIANSSLTNSSITFSDGTTTDATALGGTFTVTGGTGLTSTVSTGAVTLAIDTTVVTLTGTQTLTNKSIDASQLTGTVDNARLDQQLQDVAGMTPTDSNFIVGDGTNFVLESGATARTSLGLTIGTDVQAWDADLDALAGLTSAADKGIYWTGANTAGTFDFYNIGRTFLGATNVGNAAGSQRKLLGLDNDDNVTHGSLGVGTTASGTTGEIRATDNITAYYSSDMALKENVTVIDNALDKLKQLNGVFFDWTKEYMDKRGGEDGYFVKKKDTGIIAQDVEKVLPEIVRTKQDGFKGVQYEKLAGLLIEAIKELNEKVDNLRKS